MAKFGEYEILETLGRGGMGAVYKVRHTATSQVAALKMLTAAGATSEAARERFMAEARAMARLRHRNIVSVHEVGRHRGVPFLAMDFVEGRSLQQIIRDGAPDERESAVWAMKIAAAVHHAHETGIVHRDLKPANVMIDGEGEPVVMDFGLAKDVIADLQLTQADEILGTPSYMSPEQVRGEAPDPRSDVFALGGILYALLTGRAPYTGPAPVVLFKVCHRDPDPPSRVRPGISRDLETICLKAMRRSADDRYPAAAAMAADLQAFLDAQPIQAKPESRLRRWARAARERPRAVVAGIACCVVVAGALLWTAWPTPAAPPGAAAPVTPPGSGGLSRMVLDEVDRLVIEKQYDEALSKCREALADATDTTLQGELNSRMQWIQDIQSAAARAVSAPVPPGGAPSSPPTAAERLAEADALLLRDDYDGAIAIYRALLDAATEPSLTAQMQQRLQWAQQLRDGARTATPPAAGDTTAAQTVESGDRLLAACRFEEALAAYQASGSGAARQDMATRLVALRERGAQALTTGRRPSVDLADGRRVTVVSVTRQAAVIADAAGTVRGHAWDSLAPPDVCAIYRACIPSPTAQDRVGLGLLCLALGLDAEARTEFAEAVRLEPARQQETDAFLAVQLNR